VSSFLDQNTMKSNRLLPLAILLAAAGIVAFTIIRTRTSDETSRTPGRPVPLIQTSVVAGVPAAATNQPGQAGNAVIPAEKLPAGWQDFRTITEQERLDRVTAAMENHTLPADLLAFFETEIFNREHWDVTRNNMANALVWQESPNPRLHELFAKMLADESESPVWRDYCLQFLSECLKSSSDPEAIKSLLTRYAQGKDGLAGTAIVNVGLQEAAGRMKPGETFSQQLEAQLTDPEVVTPTKLSILAMIGKRNDVRLLPLVRTYATNTNDSLRRCAIATLGQIGTPDDLPLIRAGLTDPNRAVKMAADAALKAMERRK
jgi:HEAT repeat protein